MPNRNYSNTAPPVSLTAAATSVATTLTVASTTGYPAAPFLLGLERGTANEEVVLCTATSATTFTVTRGYDGTSAKAHAIGTSVEHTVAAIDYAEAAQALDTANAANALAGTANTSVTNLRNLGDAKGDLIGFSAADTPARVPAGTGRAALLADGAAAAGVRFGTDLLLGGYRETCPFITTSGTTTLDLSTAATFRLTQNQNTTMAFSNVPPSGEAFSVTIVAVQDGTGGRTISWPASVKWSMGLAPNPVTTANRVNIYTLLTVDGGTNWYGFLSGEDMR